MSRSRHRRRSRGTPSVPILTSRRPTADDVEYRRACSLLGEGNFDEARTAYASLSARSPSSYHQALIENDLGTMEASQGGVKSARRRFKNALALDAQCAAARENLELLDRVCTTSDAPAALQGSQSSPEPAKETHVAIVSLLFNWPSTGGGTIHTWECGKFLCRAGYEVRHIYAVFPEWGIGNVTESLPVATEPLPFNPADWSAPEIQRRFREAVDRFAPDYVIVTDSWSFKPLLAEAVRGYRYFLRLAAQECLCPLNNVRLLVGEQGQPVACPKNQLATSDACWECVAANGRLSGSLHQAERALSGFGTAEYDRRLRQAFAEAEGILVVNPLIATMVAPYAKAVHVVPSGFDPARFPWPWPDENNGNANANCTTLFFAGLVDEYMKGFHILRAACRTLWAKRQDFELVATGEPRSDEDPFVRYVGWLSQQDIPRQLRAADIVVFPTIAEEALGRSAVEAMGVGRPVIASRIGGLPFTVTDGVTGLLFEPGNAADLAAKIETLLDDRALQQRLGRAGRQRFEEQYTWDRIIDRDYRRLLPRPREVCAMCPPTTDYKPHFQEPVNHERLLRDAAAFFGLSVPDVRRMFGTYRDYHDAEGYARTLGELKTLSFEEAFLIGVHVSLTRPPHVVEIGTGQGRSTRRLVDLCQFLGLDARVSGYEVADQLRHVTRDEFDFHVTDLTGRFRMEILDRLGSGCVFVDVHLYPFLREVLTETLTHFGNWTLAIHDCGRGLCNPRMPLAKDDRKITSLTGVWERHLLAEHFGIADPLNPELDDLSTATHRLKIFETQHGLGMLVPRHVCGSVPVLAGNDRDTDGRGLRASEARLSEAVR